MACLRIVLIHDYRRLLLRDPELPDILLAAEWPGQKARLLCKELYRRLAPASERHLDRCLVLADGTIPPPTRPSPTASRRTTRWRRCRCRLIGCMVCPNVLLLGAGTACNEDIYRQDLEVFKVQMSENAQSN